MTALAGSVVAAMKPAINNADNVIESFILISLCQKLEMTSEPSALRGSPLEASTERAFKTDHGTGWVLMQIKGAFIPAGTRTPVVATKTIKSARRHACCVQTFGSFPRSLLTSSVIRNTSKIMAVDHQTTARRSSR